MGTGFSFQIEVPDGEESVAGAAIVEAVRWLHWVDATFSTYRPDSEISRLANGDLAEQDCHPEVRSVLDLAEQLRVDTDGWFDIEAGGRLDPSGVVKGWSIERASEILAGHGCTDHLVEGGGDIRMRGAPSPGSSWRVALVHPFALGSFCAVLAPAGLGAVATSGTYERGFHVIDPHSGRPVRHTVAATVIGSDITTADAYATAALAMGGERAIAWLEPRPGFEAMVIDHLGRAVETSGFARHRLEQAAGG